MPLRGVNSSTLIVCLMPKAWFSGVMALETTLNPASVSAPAATGCRESVA